MRRSCTRIAALAPLLFLSIASAPGSAPQPKRAEEVAKPPALRAAPQAPDKKSATKPAPKPKGTAPAKKAPPKKPSAMAPPALPGCQPLPSAASLPWQGGERLAYDVDVMGAQAGKLTLVAFPPLGSGGSQEIPLRALAASNSFFSKIRHVRGRSSSYVRTKDLHPRKFSEETNEGGVLRSADVVFRRPEQGGSVSVKWKRDKRAGQEDFRSNESAFDSLSAAYYLRAMPLEVGQELCFDSYAIRKLWRVTGKVKGIETVKVPAGTFQAFHLEGSAVRVDKPESKREIHIWISNDEKRLPLAALGIMDLGPVRAQLVRIGGENDDAFEEEVSGDLPKQSAPPALRR